MNPDRKPVLILGIGDAFTRRHFGSSALMAATRGWSFFRYRAFEEPNSEVTPRSSPRLSPVKVSETISQVRSRASMATRRIWGKEARRAK